MFQLFKKTLRAQISKLFFDLEKTANLVTIGDWDLKKRGQSLKMNNNFYWV